MLEPAALFHLSPTAWVVILFHVFILFVMALDLGVLHRRARVAGVREAALWTGVWISSALMFALLIWRFWPMWRPDSSARGSDKALEFVTGYVTELSLSVDNLFVFMVIFRYFGVALQFQHRVLFWGILGALFMRAGFILTGAVVLDYFHWAIYLLGGLLLFTSYRMLRSRKQEFDPEKNLVLRLAQRYLPVVHVPTQRFFVYRSGRWFATSLLLVLLVIESTDVVFAVDSIPAIFGITRDPFIVYTSNILAILGLRSLFFLLAGFLEMFRYLNVGLSLVLGFIGLKMIVQEPLRPYLQAVGIGERILVLVSLIAVTAILAVTVLASVIAGRPARSTASSGESDTPAVKPRP